MLRFLGHPKTLCDGITRRDLLHVGGLGAFGFGLADWLDRRAAADSNAAAPGFGRAKACILIYKYGSPPQHETFDPKPQAPREIQGEFGAISSAIPGVAIGDRLPRIAAIADRLTIVRSLTHPYPLHGTVYAVSGIPEVDTKIEAQPRHKRQWPFLGSIVDYIDDRRSGGRAPDVPRNIAIPFAMGSKTEYPPLAGPYGAFLGTRYDPVYTEFAPEGTRMAPAVRPGKAFREPFLGIRPADRLSLCGGGSDVSPRQLGLRRSLLEQFDRTRRWLEAEERVATYGSQQAMAYSLLTSGRVNEALDYTREPQPVRERYGMTLFGQCCLAARRLIEAGTRFVTVIWDAYGLNAGSWDTHWNHFERLDKFLLPVFDQSFSALILDLGARGLLDETLVLVISEHGRTPKIDDQAKGGGRNHWSRAYSQVYAGGGLGKGLLVGRTNAEAGDVESTPISPKDVLATSLYLLGVDPHGTIPNAEGRPMPIAGSGVLRSELLG
jgi:hypothetical protein